VNSFVAVSWLSWLLGRLPRPLVAMLDGWSYGIALRKAQRRRQPIPSQE